ncbi:MAG: protein kinase [bacterium]|nr:protein kinase [bacterium]
MGAILHVTALANPPQGRIVLKYCRETDDEYVNRFRREVRLLNEFAGNSKVVQILDENLAHDPPYYVMPFYPDGDLMSFRPGIAADPAAQEQLFCQMIDCVAELHNRGKFHRDIKPQNFLRDTTGIRVSDLGLSMERDSLTAFTATSQFWGTQGYLPPEYHTGGFKHADSAGDIFMLGKSFYVLLTGRDPLYLIGNDIPDPLFHIIQKCCSLDKARRYQTLAELKQAVVAVFDIALGRADGIARARQLLTAISTRLDQQNQFNADEVNEFMNSLARLEPDERLAIVSEIPSSFYRLLSIDPLAQRVGEYLGFYRPMVEAENYGWGYAEVIASNMKMLFDSTNVDDQDKAQALDLALHAAHAMHRFAAMDTCRAMITSVASDGLAILTRDVLRQYPHPFVYNIELVNCKHDTVTATIRDMKAEAEADAE